MSYVAKVSLDGYDVTTATPEQCSVHSEYPPLKAKLGQTPRAHIALLDVDFTATITQNLTQNIYTVDHGYGYIPLSLSNIIFTPHSGSPITGIGYAAIGATLEIKAYSTTSQFIVSIYDNFNWTGSNARLQVSYYIFAENGS